MQDDLKWKARVKWVKDLFLFVVSPETGHTIVPGWSWEAGLSRYRYASNGALLCWASVAATSFDVIDIWKSRQDVTDWCGWSFRRKRSDGAPQSALPKFMCYYTITGRNLKQNFVDSCGKAVDPKILLRSDSCWQKNWPKSHMTIVVIEPNLIFLPLNGA